MGYIKTPVRYCPEDWMIFDADDQWLASLDVGEVGPEMVEIINSHADLLAACEKAREYLAEYSVWLAENPDSDWHETMDQLDAAIAKAKGE